MSAKPAAGTARYNIVRCYFNAGITRRIVRRDLTLEQAMEHCSDPETSSGGCTSVVGRRRTRRLGRWFDSYTEVRPKRAR